MALAPIIYIKTSSPPKFGGLTPIRKNFGPRTVLAQHTPILVCLRQHVFGCQIRSTGSWAPIFRVQSHPGAPRGRDYCLLVLDSVIFNLMKMSIFDHYFGIRGYHNVFKIFKFSDLIFTQIKIFP